MNTNASRILLINGHPDPLRIHLCHAMLDAYREGAEDAGHQVRTIEVARLDFPMLRSKAEWDDGETPPALRPVQDDIHWARHVVFCFPLWLGDMPAVLKAFLEQVARPGFAVARGEGAAQFAKLLAGRSARVIVTMGMPALVYRWYFRAHSLKSLERNILGFVGFAPVRETIIGSVDALGDEGVDQWRRRMRRLGRAGG